MPETIIRKFTASDRQAVRDIAWETAFMGESAERFFSGKEILCDFLTRYFTDYEPQSCFVAESAGSVVGYLIGSVSLQALEQKVMATVIPFLVVEGVLSGVLFRQKNLRFLFHVFASFLKGEFQAIGVRQAYPATMHINIRDGFRGQGIGKRLIDAFCEYLKSRNVAGFHLATISNKAGVFFRQQGMKLIGQYRRSYYQYLVHQDTMVCIYAKRLQ